MKFRTKEERCPNNARIAGIKWHYRRYEVMGIVELPRNVEAEWFKKKKKEEEEARRKRRPGDRFPNWG
jgi:hypothetical protein